MINNETDLDLNSSDLAAIFLPNNNSDNGFNK